VHSLHKHRMARSTLARTVGRKAHKSLEDWLENTPWIAPKEKHTVAVTVKESVPRASCVSEDCEVRPAAHWHTATIKKETDSAESGSKNKSLWQACTHVGDVGGIGHRNARSPQTMSSKGLYPPSPRSCHTCTHCACTYNFDAARRY
jgi:hypothetical protein